MLRKKQILKEVYERQGQKAHGKLAGVHAEEKMVNKELGQVRTLMEVNSSRLNPDYVEFNETMDILKISRKYEKTNILEMTKPQSFTVENQYQKGFNWLKNNDFYSKMLDLDPSRH